jgi:hypothetical protein
LVVLAAGAGVLDRARGAELTPQKTRVSPGDFVRAVDNPWYPLRPGTTYVYRGVEGGSVARDVVTVERRTKVILGVRCVVVRDLVYHADLLVEQTADWYAQDRKGNVWYFGEATAELDRQGRVVTTEGSWKAGVDGAEPGIVMSGSPRVGQAFPQEFYRGHAEDHFRILSLSARVRTPYVSSRRAMLTTEWTPLEPGVVDRKLYVRGIGMVLDQSADGSDRIALTSVTRR